MPPVGVINGQATAPGTDLCKTQAGPAVVLIPYANIAPLAMATPIPAILIAGTPAINIKSKVSLTQGDQVGAVGGVISSSIMGEGQFTTGSVITKLNGAPAVVMGMSMTLQNKQNTPGTVMLVGQATVQAGG
jgi:hypothetical protein